MTIEEFRKRMGHQREMEAMALDRYMGFASELKPGKYRDMFLRIADDERRHVALVDEILKRL